MDLEVEVAEEVATRVVVAEDAAAAVVVVGVTKVAVVVVAVGIKTTIGTMKIKAVSEVAVVAIVGVTEVVVGIRTTTKMGMVIEAVSGVVVVFAEVEAVVGVVVGVVSTAEGPGVETTDQENRGEAAETIIGGVEVVLIKVVLTKSLLT